MGAVIDIKGGKAGKQAATAENGLRLLQGRVIAGGEGLVVVETALGARACRQAASCLLRPEAGDLVLASLPEAENTGVQAYVLAVLERGEADAPAQLDLPSGAVLSAPAGAVRIEAAQGIGLATAGEFSAVATEMTFSAGGVRWLAGAWSLVGKALEFVTKRWTETAEERDTQAGTWTQRLGDSFRHVEELDETQAAMVRTLARETALLHGRVTYVQAEEFVKADGEEVHLG